jgi:hypothetical protein
MRESSDPAWESETVSESVESALRGSRRRRSGPPSEGLSRRRLRTIYFSLASMWGFLAGTVAVLGGLTLSEQDVSLDTWLSLLLLVAAGLAVVGGAVLASAYRDASRRRYR